MKKRNIIIGITVLLLSVISFFGHLIYKFKQVQDIYIRLIDKEVENIRLINIGQGDREYIAKILQNVSNCDPSIIALDVFFKTYDSTTVDTLLLNSIATSQAILGTRYNMGAIYAVHLEYLNAAYNYGYAEIEAEEDYVSHFNLYEQGYKDVYKKKLGKKRIFHFAYKIANEVDSAAAAKYLKEIPQSRIPIVISRLTDQFKIYDYQDLDFPCDDIRGKIIIIGYLGPTNEDKHITYARYYIKKNYGTEPDMYGPIIVANQILMILEGIH